MSEKRPLPPSAWTAGGPRGLIEEPDAAIRGVIAERGVLRSSSLVSRRAVRDHSEALEGCSVPSPETHAAAVGDAVEMSLIGAT